MDKVRVLFLAANPTGTSQRKLDEEIRTITQKIRAAQYRDILELKSAWAVRPDDLLQSLNEYKPQIVHFSTQGSAIGEIILVDKDGSPKAVSTRAIKVLFTALKDNIHIVLFNACYSRSQAEAITEVIDCAIGMNEAIGDEAAITFAASFYRAIGFGRSVQEAFDQGKAALLLEGLPEENTLELFLKKGIDPSTMVLIRQSVSSRKRRSPKITQRPRNYIRGNRDSKFQARQGEFEQLEQWLFEAKTDEAARSVGIVGMAGIGKTRLVLEFAYQYKSRFPAGVFWMRATGTTIDKWRSHFAELAKNTEYLPPNDEKLPSEEKEERRARHICSYLAEHTDALLILDNVEKPDLVVTAFSELIGRVAKCSILYTSRYSRAPLSNVRILPIRKLSEASALELLLEYRPRLLANLSENGKDKELQTVRDISNYVERLPLALMLLSKLLQDPYLTVKHLNEELRLRGTLEITREYDQVEVPLYNTFILSWGKVQNLDAQYLFKVACCFPKAFIIPIDLLGIATGFGRGGVSIIDPLGKALTPLRTWSLVERVSEEQIRLHPLIHEFGQRLMLNEEKGNIVQEAKKLLDIEFKERIKLIVQLLTPGMTINLHQQEIEMLEINILDIYKKVQNLIEIEQLKEVEIIKFPPRFIDSLFSSLSIVDKANKYLKEYNLLNLNLDTASLELARHNLVMFLYSLQELHQILAKSIEYISIDS